MSLGCRPLDDQEIDRLLAFCDPMEKALFCLGIRTGFRISELLSITWKQVLTEDGRVRGMVEIPKRKMKGKTASRRLPIHGQAAQYLLEWRKISENPDRVFPIHRATAHRRLKKLAKGAGIDMEKGRVATHTLRKSFARKMYKALDQDLFKLQKLMGHSSIQITCKYLRLDDDELDDIVRNSD